MTVLSPGSKVPSDGGAGSLGSRVLSLESGKIQRERKAGTDLFWWEARRWLRNQMHSLPQQFLTLPRPIHCFRLGRITHRTMFTLFKSRPNLPASFNLWSEVDIVAGSEYLHEGPSVADIRTLKQWLDTYVRWRAGYDAFVKAAGTLESADFTDDFDRRQHEHYAALFLQSGQWRAILLMLLEDLPEAERSRYVAEIDGILVDLRRRIARL